MQNSFLFSKVKEHAFRDALIKLDKNYDRYKKAVSDYKKYLEWNLIARIHVELYHSIIGTTTMFTSNMAVAGIVKNTASRRESIGRGDKRRDVTITNIKPATT